jgi:hypothetical protein
MGGKSEYRNNKNLLPQQILAEIKNLLATSQNVIEEKQQENDWLNSKVYELSSKVNYWETSKQSLQEAANLSSKIPETNDYIAGSNTADIF